MKHNKLLIGLVSTGIAFSTIPLVTLVSCNKNPTTPVYKELNIDDSLVYYQTDGYIRTLNDTSGSCYLTGFKLESEQSFSDLTVTVENLEGTDASTYVEIEQVKGTKYFNVNVYFASQYPLKSQYAYFDLKISDSSQNQKTFTGFKVYAFTNSVQIKVNGAEQKQIIGTFATTGSYSYNFLGTFSLRGSEQYPAEELKKLSVRLKNKQGEVIPETTIKPTIVVNEEDDTFGINFYIPDISTIPESQILFFEFTSSNPILSDWIGRWHEFTLQVLTDANQIFECVKNGSEATLKSCHCTDETVTVPDEITIGTETLPITTIGTNQNPNAFKRLPAKTINFSDNVKTISEAAILECYELTKIKLGKSFHLTSYIAKQIPSLDTIEVDEQNTNCYVKNDALISKTTNILFLATNKTTSIPSEVQCIYSFAFANRSLTEITIPNSVKAILVDSFRYCDKLTKVSFEQGSPITILPAYSFANCSVLETITLPESLETIGYDCFLHCSSLKNITIPSTVTLIEGRALAECSSLQSITLPQSLEEIGANAFASCLSLEQITIPASTIKISNNAFISCVSLAKIEVEQDNPVYCSDANKSCLLKYDEDKQPSILVSGTFNASTIPDYVKTIEDNAFAGCLKLKTLNLSNVTKIGVGSFGLCEGLTTVTFPENNQIELDSDAFHYCLMLKTLNNTQNITSLGKHCFRSCASLETVDFSTNENLEVLPDGTFIYCYDLKTIKLPPNLKTISADCFSSCTALETIDIPDSVETLSTAAFFRCSSLTTVNFGEDSQLNKISPLCFGLNLSLENLTIPKSVTSIEGYSVVECVNLQSVTFKDPKNWYLDKQLIDESLISNPQLAASILYTQGKKSLVKKV